VAAILAGLLLPTIAAGGAAPPAVIGPSSVLEAGDFATEELRDPWDYEQVTDGVTDGSPLSIRVADARITDGMLRFTSQKDSYITLRTMAIPANTAENGDTDGALVDQTDGLRYPIEAGRYTHLTMPVYSSDDGVLMTFQWFGCHAYSVECLGGRRVLLRSGWQTVHFEIARNVGTAEWDGDILGLRLTFNPAETVDVRIDHLRLHEIVDPVAVSVVGDELYWDTDTNPGNIGDPNRTGWGAIPVTDGTGLFDVSGLPPGTYHLWSDGQYGDTVTVRERPRPVIDDPDLAGGVDYASEVLNNPWDFADQDDVTRLCNVRDVAWLDTATRPDGTTAMGVLRATNDWIRCGTALAERNDPWLQLPLGPDGLDPEHYHRVSWTGWYDGGFDLADAEGGGAHGRLIWRRSDTPRSPTLQYEDGREMVQYTNRKTYVYDMKDTTWGKVSEHEDNPWTGRTINFLRFDPNEDRGARRWYLDDLRIAADDMAAPTFQITWHDASGTPGTRATVGLDTNRTGFDGEIPAAGITQRSGSNRLLFDATDRLPATYWAHVTSTNHTTGDSSRIYATGPLEVSPRIAGAGREQTAVELSQQRFRDGAATAIVVDSRNFPDALAAGPLAARLGAPILLTGPSLSSDVTGELARLGVSRVLVVGGPASVSEQVEAELAAIGWVRRIHGDGRDQTSVAVAQEIIKDVGAANVIVASGATFPDALAAGPLAAARDTAILLVDPVNGSGAVTDFVVSADPKALTVVGGEASVPDEVADSVAGGRPWDRLAGIGRFETAAEVVAAAVDAGADPRHVLVASGEGFPDALAAGAAIAHVNGVLVLTGKYGLPVPTQASLADAAGAYRSWRVIGGHNTVTHATVRSLLGVSGLG